MQKPTGLVERVFPAAESAALEARLDAVDTVYALKIESINNKS